jgi:hypothetical protein
LTNESELRRKFGEANPNRARPGTIRSIAAQSFYWMIHCEHCGMKLGDFELFEEFDTPFCLIDVRDAGRILLHPFREPFVASATSLGYEPGFFERMRILH